MRRPLSISLTGSHVLARGAHELRVPVHDGDWRAALSEVLALSRAQRPRDTPDVHAQLGADHARVAIMTIDQDGGLVSIPTAKQEGLVHAWAADMLHVTAGDQVIRWRALADPRQVLVSCVARAVAEDLESACKDAAARLASCRPAIFATVDAMKQMSPSADADNLTVVWTEDGDATRHPCVQLLRFRARRLVATWRGWLPPAVDADAEVDAMVTRFESETGGSAGRTSVHWPAPAAA